ncbi:hypothetical protein KAR91_11220 [Candidatus Pacearchaeota archaeon]|nr:hypothetical protein [Candidatus Pacearchaeota archaeon]
MKLNWGVYFYEEGSDVHGEVKFNDLEMDLKQANNLLRACKHGFNWLLKNGLYKYQELMGEK